MLYAVGLTENELYFCSVWRGGEENGDWEGAHMGMRGMLLGEFLSRLASELSPSG